MITALQTDPFRRTANDGQPIDGHRWCGSGPPRALLQIADGLGEHALRYRLLTNALAARGWALQDANAVLPDPRTAFDWLSRDAAQVDAYIADPLCGFSLTLASRRTLVAACAPLADPAVLARIPQALPIYLFSGDQDPVNRYLDWFWSLAARYKAAGLHDVSLHVYGGGRHEMLNETNRAELTAQLTAWCQRAARLGG